MEDLNFNHERIMFMPDLLYIDYINLHFKNCLKKNYENITPSDFTYFANISFNPNGSQKDLAVLLFVSESNVVKYNFNYNENALDKGIID